MASTSLPISAGGSADARLPIQARHEIRHLRLMLVGHQCDDVADRRQISRRVEFLDQRDQVLAAVGHQRVRIGRIRGEGVGAIALFTVRCGDVPASPAVSEGRSMIGNDRAAAVGIAAGIGVDGSDKDSWNAERGRSLMAVQAHLASGEFRFLFAIRVGAPV